MVKEAKSVGQAEMALQFLKRIYPRAASYTDIWKFILPATATDQIDKSGGSLMKRLGRKNQVKRITEGFYVWNPG